MFISGYGNTGLNPDRASRTFTTVNWNTPWTVKVSPTANEEDDNETDDTVTLTQSVKSDDANYSGITAPDLTVKVIDKGTPQVTRV